MPNRKSEWAVSELEVSYKPKKTKINLPQLDDAVDYLREIWDKDLIELQEQFYCLFLTSRCELISWRCLGIGTSNECLVDIKLLATLALKCNADKVIVAHNHSTGNLDPSEADEEATRALQTALNYFNIELVDHIIISETSDYSFAEHCVIIPEKYQKRKYHVRERQRQKTAEEIRLIPPHLRTQEEYKILIQDLANKHVKYLEKENARLKALQENSYNDRLAKMLNNAIGRYYTVPNEWQPFKLENSMFVPHKN